MLGVDSPHIRLTYANIAAASLPRGVEATDNPPRRTTKNA